MTDNEKNIKAIFQANEVKVFDRNFFVKHGKRGGIKSASQWDKLDKTARSKRAKKGWKKRRENKQKLSTV